MSFLKSLRTDLVEKRLWPVAALLLLALVAVPLALGGGGGDGGADASLSAPIGATGTTGTVAQIALDQAVPLRRDRAGSVRDPFLQRKVATGPTGVTATTGPSAPGGVPKPPAGGGAGGVPKPPAGGGAGGGPKGPAGPPPPTKPTPRKPAPPAPDPLDSYVVTLRLERTDGGVVRRTVERLTPLPSHRNPLFVYLGVLSNAKSAVFMLSSDVIATGEGTCKPRKSSCETVELSRGETERFVMTGDDGQLRRYELKLVTITKETATAPSRAVAASKKASAKGSAGAAAKAAAAAVLGSESYSFEDATGLLHRVKGAATGTHRPSVDDAAHSSLRGVAAEAVPVAGARFFPGP